MNALGTIFPFLRRRRNYKDAVHRTYIHVNIPPSPSYTCLHSNYIGITSFATKLKSIPVQSDEERRVLKTIANMYLELHLHGYAGVILTTTSATYVLHNHTYPVRDMLPLYAAFATVDILTTAAVDAAG